MVKVQFFLVLQRSNNDEFALIKKSIIQQRFFFFQIIIIKELDRFSGFFSFSFPQRKVQLGFSFFKENN